MGKAFQENDCICIIPDYRNYPQTDIDGMLDDVTLALDWIHDNIEEFNGDPEDVTLIGQSAGAHITSLILLKRKFNLKIKRWIGISGVYNPRECLDLWSTKGLPQTIIEKIFGDLDTSSPTAIVENKVNLNNFPTTWLIHGSNDSTAPDTQTKDFARLLQEKNVITNLSIYSGK